MKKRIFAFDFIRAIATIIIIITHYNALFIYNVYRPELFIGSIKVFNIYIGDFGVSLFLILSGAALMYKYMNKDFNIKDFYINRFKKILPFYWFSYLVILSITIFKYGNSYIDRIGIPKIRYIFTLLGIDGYLSCMGFKTFYIVGEWFIGFILIYYIIFPFLYYMIKKHPKITAIIGIIVYIASIICFKQFQYNNLLIPVRIIELLFGMYFVYFKDKINYKHAILCWIILMLQLIFSFGFDRNIMVTVVGISSFVLLYYVASFFEKREWIQGIFIFVSQLSFPCFLIHHWLILEMVSKVDLNTILPSTSYIIFGCLLLVTFACSYFLQKAYDVVNKCIFNGLL